VRIGGGDERVVRQRVPGLRVDPEHLAAEAVTVLRYGRPRGVARADQQRAVGRERRTAAGVAAARVDRQPGQEVVDLGRARLVVGEMPGDQPDVDGVAVFLVRLAGDELAR